MQGQGNLLDLLFESTPHAHIPTGQTVVFGIGRCVKDVLLVVVVVVVVVLLAHYQVVHL